MRLITLTALALMLMPLAAADHPGSNLGLLRYGNPGDVQNLVHNQVTVNMQFTEWESEYPDLVARFSPGVTEGEFVIPGIIITDENAQPNWTHGGKLVVYLDGSHHGNEYLSTELLMYYVEDLLTRSEQDDVAHLLSHTEIHVVPIINIEGNLRDTRINLNGFDPNRNYDLGHAACSIPGLTCGGPEPFSESEIRANADYVLAISPDLWLSAHTGVALLYYNAGEPYIPQAPDHDLFLAMEPLFEASTNGVIDMTGGPAPAVGSADDWGYSVAGTPTFTYEVHEDQFLPVYGEPIPQVLEDQLNGLHWLVDNAGKLGAWIEIDNGTVTNHGLGVARNITVSSDLGTQLIAELGAGNMTEISVAGSTTWSYNVLQVESSRVRTHSAHFPVAEIVEPVEESPAVFGVLLVGLIALAARRRRN